MVCPLQAAANHTPSVSCFATNRSLLLWVTPHSSRSSLWSRHLGWLSRSRQRTQPLEIWGIPPSQLRGEVPGQCLGRRLFRTVPRPAASNPHGVLSSGSFPNPPPQDLLSMLLPRERAKSRFDGTGVSGLPKVAGGFQQSQLSSRNLI